MNDNGRRLIPRRARSQDRHVEVEAILRDASRADPGTLADIISELRTQPGNAGTQAEIDGVIARFRAAHPERRTGNEPTAVTGPGEGSGDEPPQHR